MKWLRFVRVVGSVIWPFAHPFVPSYDPLSRRRVRQAARGLVTLTRWPGKEATSKEAAQLALLRSLELQRLTRNSSRLRQHEAAALLARSAVETTIIGIWCICDDNAIKALSKDNAYSLERLMLPLLSSMFLPPDAVKTAVAKLDVPHRFFIKTPLEAIEKNQGSPVAQSLYEVYYGHLSSFFGHGTGLSLLRHTAWDDRLTEHASFPWAKRSPAHLVDVCLGVLCAAAAGSEHPNYKLFVRYASFHEKRTAIPLGGIAGVHLVRDAELSLRSIVDAFREMQAVADFAISEAWGEATSGAKVERVEQGLTTIFAAFGLKTPEITRLYVEHLVHLIDARNEGSVVHVEDGAASIDASPFP